MLSKSESDYERSAVSDEWSLRHVSFSDRYAACLLRWTYTSDVDCSRLSRACGWLLEPSSTVFAVKLSTNAHKLMSLLHSLSCMGTNPMRRLLACNDLKSFGSAMTSHN